MYETYFAFSERPFSIAPDPRFLFLSERHREALAHLVYGLNDAGGFVMLTGEVGTGKTTLCRSLLAQVPENIDVAFVLNPRLDAVELLETVCDELHIDTEHAKGSIKQLVDRINAHLLASNATGRSTVLLIDEAQNLSSDVLEQLRLLTNLETNERKLLRIILIGQPELADKLARPDLRQLAQRITARYHLEALQAADTSAYVEHRLQVAGARSTLFAPPALRALHQASGGVPRLINVIADRALLGAYALGKREITAQMVRKAAVEVSGPSRGGPWPSWLIAATAGGIVAAVALAAWVFLPRTQTNDAVAAVVVSPGSAAMPADARAITPPAITTDNASAAAFADEDPLLIGPPEGSAAMDSGDKPAVAESERSGAVVVRAQLPAWPDYVPREESEDRAFAELFERWRSPFDLVEGTTPCVYARKVGLGCLRGNGGLGELRTINRPAVIELTGDGTSVHSAALVGVHAREVDVVIADRIYRVPVASLARAWDGRFTVLWQLPPEYRGPVGPGAKGTTVAWLRQQLQEATGQPIPGTAQDAFDPTLRTTLERWQAAQGLSADGQAGPRTWIALHDAAGLPAPHLQLSSGPSPIAGPDYAEPITTGPASSAGSGARALRPSRAVGNGMLIESADHPGTDTPSPTRRGAAG